MGGHPSDPESHNTQTGKVDYQMIRGKGYFKQGIKRLMDGLSKYRVCIMCAEENPASCHRDLLVAENMRQSGVKVLHIRGDGRIQTEEELWKEKSRVAANQYQLQL